MGTWHWAAFWTASAAAASMRSTASSGWMQVAPPPTPSSTGTVVMAGMKVYGMGEKKTPKPFIVACDKFVYIESLKASEASVPAARPGGKKKAAAHAESEPEPKPLTVQELIAQSVEDLADEDGYAYLGDVGTLLLKKQPDFDSRNYGFSKLSRFIASLDCFEIDERRNANYGGTQVFLRNKK